MISSGEMEILNKYKKLIAVFLPLLLTVSFFLQIKPAKVKGNTLNYSNTIYVNLSMHNSDSSDLYSLNFSLTDNYLYIDGGNRINLNSNSNYQLNISSGIITLICNGTSIASTSNNIIIEPQSADSLIKFRKPTEKDNLMSFKGIMLINKKSNTSLQVINKLSLEEYVKGVVPYEMSNSYPIEALKAQAVAARTYALYQIIHNGNFNNYGYNIGDGTSYQVYNGYSESSPNCNNAVDSTRGEILTCSGEVIESFFTSSNGGATEKSSNVWYSDLPYLKINTDIYDSFPWSADISQTYLNQIIAKNKNIPVDTIVSSGIDITSIQTFDSDPSNPSKRIKYLKIVYSDIYGSNNYIELGKDSARTFFNIIDGNLVKSALYTVSLKDGQYIFNGKGFGHGLGLSQQASRNRALGIIPPNTNSTVKPETYSEILSFYYKNTVLDKINEQIAEFENSIGGKDRYETAMQIADNSYSSTFDNVILANGGAFPDALSAAPLAKELNAPILFVDTLPAYPYSQKTLNYLLSKLNKNGTIYLIGGTGVISKEFEKLFASGSYKNYGYKVKRLDGHLYGSDRYATNADIVKNLSLAPNTPIIIASGKDFPDGLSASSLAAQKNWPIFLVGDTLSSYTEEEIKNIAPSNIYIIGGTGAVSENVKSKIQKDLGLSEDKIIRIWGSTRYETNLALNNYFMKNSDLALIASGRNFPDALAGSVYAYKNSAPIILVNDGDSSCAKMYLQSNHDSGVMTKIKPLGKLFDNDNSLKNLLTYSN